MLDYKDIQKDYTNNTKTNNTRLIKVFLFIFIGGILFVVCFVVFVYATRVYSYYVHRFYVVKHVYINGNKILNKKFIITSSGIKKEYMLRYNKEIIYNHLSSIPWFKSVYVAKLYPNTIYIKIFEKLPMAIVSLNKKKYFVNSNGNIITEYKNDKESYLTINPEKLLKINIDYTLVKSINKSLIKKLFLYKQKLDKMGKINYIDIKHNGYGIFHFQNGLNVIVNTIGCSEESFTLLYKVWNKLFKYASKLESVTMCLGNKILLKWKKGVK